jgi:hypothetical protein
LSYERKHKTAGPELDVDCHWPEEVLAYLFHLASQKVEDDMKRHFSLDER